MKQALDKARFGGGWGEGELSTFIIKLSLKWNPVGPHSHHLFLISSPKLCYP
jgi:hypothetical protein